MKKRTKKQLKTQRRNILLGVLAAGLAVLISLGIDQYYRLFVCNMRAKTEPPEALYVYPHTSMDSLVVSLSQVYDLRSVANFKWHARLLKMAQPKPGRYVFGTKEGDLNVIRRLRGGLQTPVEVSFRNLRTPNQLAGCLAEQLLLDSASLMARFQDNDYMARYNLNSATAVCLFLPNTYEMYWTISPDALLDRMHQETQHFWTTERLNQAAALGLKPTEVYTIASIVEEESNNLPEYPIIAGLYYNRLQIGMPLQACPTVKFAWQDFTLRRILQRHLEIDSPYNTYRYKGLPPGPIRLVKASTLDAVLNLQKHNYLYMCANANFDGTHHYSATYAEHARYAREYQQKLNQKGIH